MRGVNFNLLPDELILTFSENYRHSSELLYFWRLVDRSDTSLSFCVQITDSISRDELWNLLYSPFNPPRTKIDYVLW